MAKFYIYERVPQYIEYRKMVEADSLEAARALAENYADVDAEEIMLDPDDAIDGLAIEHDAEPVEDAFADDLEEAAKVCPVFRHITGGQQ